MNIRHLITSVAVAVTPLAAAADAPSGEYFTEFHLDRTAIAPQFPRAEFELYVEHWLPNGNSALLDDAKTRDEVRAEIVAEPFEPVGA